MSYARWSSDDWRSDVYVYEHVSGGWTTHVSARHWVWDVQLPAPVEIIKGDVKSAEAYLTRSGEVSALHAHFSQNGHWVTLPKLDDFEDPEFRTYVHETPGECADNLKRLISLGFHVPDGVVEVLREEQDELDEENPHG